MLEKLNESEYLFRTLTEHTASGVILVRDERFEYLNPAAEHIAGYSSGRIEHMLFWELVHPEHRDMVRARAMYR